MTINHTDRRQSASATDPALPGHSGVQATEQLTEGLRLMAAEAPVSFRVTGQCMEPVIPDEAEIVVSARRRYWPGDILAFHSALGDLRVHRLIGYSWRRGRLLLQMRADASGTLDQPVIRDQVIGAVIGVPAPLAIPLRDRLSALARFLRLLPGRIRRS